MLGIALAPGVTVIQFGALSPLRASDEAGLRDNDSETRKSTIGNPLNRICACLPAAAAAARRCNAEERAAD